MNYVVAVLPDRIQAEGAYLALEAEGIKSTILGRGYKTADEFGLVDPKEQAKKQAKLMSYWLIPFGFFAGCAFSLATGLNTFAWAGEIGNHIVGGLLGAGGGAMGSVFVGGGVVWVVVVCVVMICVIWRLLFQPSQVLWVLKAPKRSLLLFIVATAD